VGEQGHGQFKQILTIQAAKRGSVVVPVSRFYPSSKTCSNCGAVKTKLLLSERVYRCETCNLVLDRDVNAARNIAGKARQLAVLDGVSIPAKQAQVSPVQSAGRCVNTPPPVEQPQSDAFPKQTTLGA
jgi:putative transposase